MPKGGGGGGGRGGGGGARGGGGMRMGGGFRGGRGGMRMGGGGFRHRFPRRFFGGGGAFFAPGGGWWGDGYPWYWNDWDYPLYLIEDEEEREEARKWREFLAMQAAQQAATQAAQLAVQQVVKAKSTKGLGLGLGIFRPNDKTARPLGQMMPHSWNALGVIFGNTTADPKVTETQKWLNGYLSKLGFTTLTVDGKLGAKTCGACAWSFGNTPDVDISTAPQAFFEVWNVCASSSQTAPTPLTQAAKTSAYTTGVTAMQAKVVDPKLVADTQTALNVGLLANGMCALSVDGKAGPATCGAQVWLIAHAGGDGLTQAQRDAIYPVCSAGSKVAPSACPPVTAVAPVDITKKEPSPEAALVAPAKPAFTGATMLAGLGIAAALGALWYVYSQKKAAGA